MAVRLVWSVVWALIMAACVANNLVSNGWDINEAMIPALLPYVGGAFVGAIFGHAIAMLFFADYATTARFAAFFAATAIMTVVFTALFFFLPQRAYFAQWHAEALSKDWFLQILFTGLGSAYLFISTGLRPLLPWGVLTLFAASLLFSRGRFPAAR